MIVYMVGSLYVYFFFEFWEMLIWFTRENDGVEH